MNENQTEMEMISPNDELKFHRKILDSLPALVYVNELECPGEPSSMKNIYANRFGYDLFGYTRKEIDELGHAFFKEIIHPDDLEVIPITVNAANDKSDSSCLVSMHRIRVKGQPNYRWFYDHGITIDHFPDGSSRRALVVSVEVTNTMNTHNQLQAALKEIKRLKSSLKLTVFTKREKEVLKLIVQGKTDKGISSALFIDIKTAKKHRNNIIHKAGVKNSAGLVAMVMEAGEY
jgi:LuxR family transcriptional regulator, quorum-sensing system regulator SdiA